jgi:hypothetical protein
MFVIVLTETHIGRKRVYRGLPVLTMQELISLLQERSKHLYAYKSHRHEIR